MTVPVNPVNYEKYLAKCTYTSKMLDSVIERPIAWGVSKLKVMNKHRETMRNLQRLTVRLPEGWVDIALDTIAAGEIFTYPYRIKKYLNRDRGSLDTEDIKFFRFFQDNPWFYTIYSIKENLPENFFKIIDYSDGKEIILYSPGLKSMYDRGANLFSALLFFNGYCYQTYGSLHYYRAFEPFDFDFFSKMLIPQYYKENDLSSAMAFRPVHFMLLDNWSELPPMYHGKEQLTQCCHTVNLSNFNSGKYSDKFTIKEKQGVIRLRLKRGKFPFNVSEFYYDSKKKRFLVFASGIKRYEKLVKLISKDITLPAVPELYATMPMIAAERIMLGKNMPVIEYDSIFEGKQRAPREKPAETVGQSAGGAAAEPAVKLNAEPAEKDELGKFNAFMSELTKRSNMGIDYSLKELSELYDIPIETALQLEGMLTKMDKRFSIDIDGGLSDFIPPPPSVRTQFRDRLQDNKLFTVAATEELKEDFKIFTAKLKISGKKKLSFENFYDNLEYSAGKIWGRGARTVLLYTFYMLCKRGFVLENVRDYAVEFLKTFWQVIFPDKKRKYLDEFIEDYSDFMVEALFAFNLIEIDKETIVNEGSEAGYLVKASGFFNKWIRLSDYFKE